MTSLTKELFDFAGRAAVQDRTDELQKYHGSYVAAHPELEQVLHEFLQALLFHKPADTLQFMHEYFTAHREKRQPYLSP